MTELLHQPGFLGTTANWAADVTLLLSILVAIGFTYGAYIAKQAQKLEATAKNDEMQLALAGRMFNQHRWIQTGAAVLNVILVLWLMVLPYRDFVVRDSGGPRPTYFYIVTTIHATIGFLAFVFGNYVVLRGNNLMIPALKFNNYKPYMRIAYILYITTTMLGVWVYWVWFVLNPIPPVY